MLAVASLLASTTIATGQGQWQDQWLEVRSRHFTVVSNAGEEEARSVSRDLERARAAFEATLEEIRLDPRQPVVVLALDDEAGLRELLPQFWDRKGARPAAAYWPGPHQHHIAVRTDLSSDLRAQHLLHEYVHLLTELNSPDPPAWLDEGLSELYGTAVIAKETMEVGRPAVQHLQVLRSRRRWIPLDELLAMKRAPDAADADRVSMFYGQSWALAHCLMLGDCLEPFDFAQDEEAGHDGNPEAGHDGFRETGRERGPEAGPGVLRPQFAPMGFAAQLRQGADPVEAARLAFGDLAVLEQALKAYVQTGRFRAVRLGTSGPAALDFARARNEETNDFEAAELRVLSPAEALAIRAQALLDGERPAAALPLLTEALALDANAGPVLETMGRLYFQENAPAEAATWFDRAIASGQATHLAHYYRAILARTLQDASPTSEEDHLRRAIALDETFAPAYARLAATLARHHRPTNVDADRARMIEALALARRATELEPDNAGYWVELGTRLLAVNPVVPFLQSVR